MSLNFTLNKENNMCTDCEVDTKTKIHPFETAGLGKAPFHFIGMDRKNSSCQYCGTAIMYRFFIQSSDGKKHFVGSDCIAKTDTGTLSRVVDAEVKKMRKLQAQERQKKNIIKKQVVTADKILKGTFPFGKYFGQNISDIAKTDLEYLIWSYKNITTGPVGDALKTVLGPIVQPVLDARNQESFDKAYALATQDQQSQHVGVVGEKIEFTATVEYKVVMNPVCYGAPCSILHSLRTANGNVFVAYYSGQEIFEKGQTYTFKATVKGHKEYKGVLQTQVTRIKLVK